MRDYKSLFKANPNPKELKRRPKNYKNFKSVQENITVPFLNFNRMVEKISSYTALIISLKRKKAPSIQRCIIKKMDNVLL